MSNIDTRTSTEFVPAPGGEQCEHFTGLSTVLPSADGCEDCLQIGGSWVHLRLCLSCGHVGCCDSSPHQHASAHVGATGHPVVSSLEPGEAWGFCYVDDLMVASV